MSEMVRRVAWAICAPNGGLGCCGECGAIVERARAAIAAMREPTEAMVSAADAVGIDSDPTEYWPAMIDEALK